MTEPLPSEEPVLPAEEGARIQGHWTVVLGQDTALVLLVLQGMLQVLLDMVLVLLVLLDTVPVLLDMLPVLQDRSRESRGTPGTPQEPAAGSPRRASLGVGGHWGSDCCRWTKRRITGDRGERRRVRWGTLILGLG